MFLSSKVLCSRSDEKKKVRYLYHILSREGIRKNAPGRRVLIIGNINLNYDLGLL